MMKRGRVSISYLCTPCGFTSDSVISTKNHIQEETHKKRTVNYCHACKMFTASRSKFTEHRFSIAHKRKMEELEKPPEEKEDKEKEAVQKKKKRVEEESREEEEPEQPKEPEDPLKCKVCNFEAEDEEDMKVHNRTESHRRKYYLMNGKMPSEEDDEENSGERPFTSLQHMTLVHKAKDIAGKEKKSRSVVQDEELKKEKTSIIETLLKEAVFEKISESILKCTSCDVKLQGHQQQKRLYAQLFVHFTSDKHIQRLRVHVKGEEAAANNPQEVEDVEEEPRPETQIEEEAETEERVVLPDPIVVSQYQFYTDEEGVEMFTTLRAQEEEDEDKPEKEMEKIKFRTDHLLYCVPCKTGLMSGKYMARHFDSAAHKEKTPPAAWRSILDLSCVLEYGKLFKCLYCNTNFMNLGQLQLHLTTRNHKEMKDDCLNEDSTFDQNIPVDPPRCDTCDIYFWSEAEMRCHMMTKLHSIRTDQANCLPITAFTENNDLADRLQSLPPPPLPFLPARIENQRGRIAGIFETGRFVIIQFSLDECLVHALFDKSRVANKDGSTLPVVGYPVTFNACRIEPEVAGLSQYVQYWASSVVMGDGATTDSLSMEMTFSQLRREEGPVIDIGLEDCKAELKAQVDTKEAGELTLFFDELAEYVNFESAVVTLKTQSYALLRIQSSGQIALLILEDISLTQLEHKTLQDIEDLKPHSEVFVNAVLMDVSRRAPYLVTSVWTTDSNASVMREKLRQASIDMYHALVLALPQTPLLADLIVPSLEDMDMSGVIDMNQMMLMGGIGEDDNIADDSIADDSISAPDDYMDISDTGETSGEKAKKPFGIRIASFAN